MQGNNDQYIRARDTNNGVQRLTCLSEAEDQGTWPSRVVRVVLYKLRKAGAKCLPHFPYEDGICFTFPLCVSSQAIGSCSNTQPQPLDGRLGRNLPHAPRTVLQGFSQVAHADLFGALQVCDCPRHFENSVKGSGR